VPGMTGTRFAKVGLPGVGRLVVGSFCATLMIMRAAVTVVCSMGGVRRDWGVGWSDDSSGRGA
jgi:hypothetical protein